MEIEGIEDRLTPKKTERKGATCTFVPRRPRDGAMRNISDRGGSSSSSFALSDVGGCFATGFWIRIGVVCIESAVASVAGTTAATTRSAIAAGPLDSGIDAETTHTGMSIVVGNDGIPVLVVDNGSDTVAAHAVNASEAVVAVEGCMFTVATLAFTTSVANGTAVAPVAAGGMDGSSRALAACGASCADRCSDRSSALPLC